MNNRQFAGFRAAPIDYREFGYDSNGPIAGSGVTLWRVGLYNAHGHLCHVGNARYASRDACAAAIDAHGPRAFTGEFERAI